MRAIPFAVLGLAMLALSGCWAPLVGDARFEALTTRDVTFAIRYPQISDHDRAPEITVYATVTAPGATWATLAEADGSGVAQRTDGEPITLRLERVRVTGSGCDASGCVRLYDVSLDAAPTVPWDLEIEAVFHSELDANAQVEVFLVP